MWKIKKESLRFPNFDPLSTIFFKFSALKVGRTEHVMGLVYGVPTVMGGKS